MWTFVGKVTSLLFNMLSRLVIAFLPRSKHLLISWVLVKTELNNLSQLQRGLGNVVFKFSVALSPAKSLITVKAGRIRHKGSLQFLQDITASITDGCLVMHISTYDSTQHMKCSLVPFPLKEKETQWVIMQLAQQDTEQPQATLSSLNITPTPTLPPTPNQQCSSGLVNHRYKSHPTAT